MTPSKDAIKTATDYLESKLGDRAGLNFRDLVQDSKIEEEIIKELALILDEFRGTIDD